MQLLCFVSDNVALRPLSKKAANRTHAAFRPKTRQAYFRMFRIFVAFCICMDVSVARADVKVILSFLECLICNKCSVAMISNYVSAIKACFVLYNLLFHILDHPKIKYFQKSVKINQHLTLISHNIMDLDSLEKISAACMTLLVAKSFKFLDFFRLSDLAPHSLAGFDPSRHLTGQDLFFTRTLVKILIKWSKTIQTTDVVQVVSLPKLKINLSFSGPQGPCFVWVASEVLPNSVPSLKKFSCFLWPVVSLVTSALFNNVKFPPRVAIFIINFAIKLATCHF